MRRSVALLAAVGAAAVLLAGPAGAAWGGAATGAARARARPPLPVLDVTATCTSNLLGIVALSWPMPPGLPAGTTYDVQVRNDAQVVVHEVRDVTGSPVGVTPPGILSLLTPYHFYVRPVVQRWLGPWSQKDTKHLSKVLVLPVTCS